MLFVGLLMQIWHGDDVTVFFCDSTYGWLGEKSSEEEEEEEEEKREAWLSYFLREKRCKYWHLLFVFVFV